MSWKEFEDYVIQLLADLYSNQGLVVTKTPYQNDGGKDGYGSFVIGPKLGNDDLSITIKMWAEVKKRSNSSVDIDDIGGHLILALDQRINRLIFITNSFFTDRARRLCESTAHRLNMGVAFIDGERLDQLSTMLQAIPPREKKRAADSSRSRQSNKALTADISIKCAFVTDPSSALDGIEAHMRIEAGEVAYWICEVAGGPARGHLVVSIVVPEDGLLTCVPISAISLRIDALNASQRVVFAVWCLHPCEFETRTFGVHVKASGGAAAPQTIFAAGKLQVRASILVPTIPPSRQLILDLVSRERARVLDDSGLSCIVLEAGAGTGKTFLLRSCIREFASFDFTHIRLDGAREDTIDKAIQSILRQGVPLPFEVFRATQPATLEVWLRKSGHALSPDVLSELPGLIGGTSLHNDDLVVQLAASVLIGTSVLHPVLLTFEDIHKVSSSVFEFMNRLCGALAFRRRGRVMMLWTSRPIERDTNGTPFESNKSTEDARASFIHRCVPSLVDSEARSMLMASLKGLSGAEADAIIRKIGTNPFALREALQYLRADGTIALSADGVYFVADSFVLRNVLQSEVLISATRHRLRWLINKTGAWFERFIVAGACLGKQFETQLALQAADAPADVDLHRAIDLCFDYEVLKPVAARSDQGQALAFDHDLVRITALREAGEKRILQVAQKLLDGSTSATGVRALLSYLAGQAQICMDAAGELMRQGQARKDHGESLLYAFLRTAILVASDGFAGNASFLRPQLEQIDDALSVADAPKLPARPATSEMIAGLSDVLGEMEQVGSLTSEVGARLLTIAQMHAGYAADYAALSKFRYYEGRREFGFENYKSAYDLFLDAERILPQGQEGRNRAMARIRLRQAICERHLGDLEAARHTMGRALRLRAGPDWKLFCSVVANLGAFYMYSNQTIASGYWSKGLRVARLSRDVGQEAHFLNDLAHIALMERRQDQGACLAKAAEAVAREHGLQTEMLRTDLLRACMFLASGQLSPAHHALLRAEDVAVAHSDLRRLWRVRANLATWSEVSGDVEAALVYDLQALAQMSVRTAFDPSGMIGGRGNRVTGALINVYMRSREAVSRYAAAREAVGTETWDAVVKLADQLEISKNTDEFSGGVGHLFQPIGQESTRRFLITE